jgi:RHS repeat-associated protein
VKSKVSITAPISTYGPGVDDILAMTIYGSGGMTNYYYLKDLANTVLALANSSGSIVESYVYDAYGNVTIRNGGGNVIGTSAYGNRFLFQGREYDYTTQLYHFRARWYDPETGRWLSNDPIGISGGLNLYAFCANNPVNFVDPMGLDVWVLEVRDSLFFHRVVVGEMYDIIRRQTVYWMSDLMPEWDYCPVVSPGKVSVVPFGYDPRKPKELLEAGYEILKKVETSACVDELTYDEAMRATRDSAWYVYLVVGNNCITYSNYIFGYAMDAQIEYNFRELMQPLDIDDALLRGLKKRLIF